MILSWPLWIVRLIAYFCRYPSDKITILTTYNGQVSLINDVLSQRCSWNPFLGRPAAVTTVDKYQGQQNDCKFHDCFVSAMCYESRVKHTLIRSISHRYSVVFGSHKGCWTLERYPTFDRCHVSCSSWFVCVLPKATLPKLPWAVTHNRKVCGKTR